MGINITNYCFTDVTKVFIKIQVKIYWSSCWLFSCISIDNFIFYSCRIFFDFSKYDIDLPSPLFGYLITDYIFSQNLSQVVWRYHQSDIMAQILCHSFLLRELLNSKCPRIDTSYKSYLKVCY